MASAVSSRQRVTSGVGQLDLLLGGLFIGDNVAWHDDSGNLASAFCLNFLQTSETQEKPIIYVSFDRSPRNLLEKLGHLADYRNLIILDCFTWGKGAGSDVFLRFYREPVQEWPCRIVRVDEPRRVSQVMEALYGLVATMTEDVRLVFESLTGMQDLWGGEEEILRFLYPFMSSIVRTQHGCVLDHGEGSAYVTVAGTDQPDCAGGYRTFGQTGKHLPHHTQG